MSLRKCVIALIVVNLAYFAYSQGWFASLTGLDAGQREPERLKRQINTEALRIELIERPADAIAPQAAPAPSTDNASAAMATTRCATIEPAAESWLVYMGPFASKDLLAKKKAELQKLSIDSREVTKGALPLGLALGSSHASEDLARQALQVMNQNGVRTATVILWSTTGKSGIAANCSN